MLSQNQSGGEKTSEVLMEIREIASAEEQRTHGLQSMTSKGESQQKHTDHSEADKKEKALNHPEP